jgi:hypothetical protein
MGASLPNGQRQFQILDAVLQVPSLERTAEQIQDIRQPRAIRRQDAVGAHVAIDGGQLSAHGVGVTQVDLRAFRRGWGATGSIGKDKGIWQLVSADVGVVIHRCAAVLF